MRFPSTEQNLVINHDGCPLLVVAAPGTGKTRTLVARMIRLLRENPDREISFITFTRASRRDTERKLRQEVGKEALDEATFDFPRISTLHTYAKSIIHKYAGTVGRDPQFSVLIEDRGERDLVLSEVATDLQVDINLSVLKKEISQYRNTNDWPPESALAEDLRGRVLQAFSLLLRFYNTIDMDGLVPTACEILAGGHAELPPIFLQVDEYQDLNPMDQRLIALAGAHETSQVVVVGDDAQSIYGFRNANFRGIKALWESRNWEHVLFPDCHRLPSHIVRASQALISNRSYLGTQVNIPDDDGNRIKTLQCTKSDIQIEVVSQLILDSLASKKNSEGNALSFKDLMVLCPTSNFVSKVARALEETYHLPTKQRDKRTIPDDYWRLLLVLRMLQYQDSLALRQWLSIVGLPEDKITQWRRDSIKRRISLYDYCSKLEAPPVKEILGYLGKLRASTHDFNRFCCELLEFPCLLIEGSLLATVGLTLNNPTRQPASVLSVIRLMHEKFGLTDPEVDLPDDDKILVTTMHSAKGLEAEFVFILWLNSDFMPSPGRDQEEERRVLYVALTRARQDVALTFHEKFDGTRLLGEEVMSPFLREIKNYLRLERVTRDYLNRR
jgi:superfamily I DNA/RNA helicase